MQREIKQFSFCVGGLCFCGGRKTRVLYVSLVLIVRVGRWLGIVLWGINYIFYLSCCTATTKQACLFVFFLPQNIYIYIYIYIYIRYICRICVNFFTASRSWLYWYTYKVSRTSLLFFFLTLNSFHYPVKIKGGGVGGGVG